MLSDFLNKTLSGAYEQEHATPLYFCHGDRPVAQLVEHRVVLPAGGREFDSGRTNTQGLKITEEKVLPL